MFTIIRQGSRVINKSSPDYVRICYLNGSAAPVSQKYGSINSNKCFSHCTSPSKDCNIFIGSHGMQNNMMVNNVCLVRNSHVSSQLLVKHDIHQHVIRRNNFHTSHCLKSYVDPQGRDKRNAKILTLMCITCVAVMWYANSLVDLEKYDRPTIDKPNM